MTGQPVNGLRIIETDGGLVADADERVSATATGDYVLSLSAQSGSGVEYFATDADLPGTAAGHPLVIVLEDSEALDDEGNPQPQLRFWNGSAWQQLGLGGGGAVTSDFIDVELVGSMLTGQVLVWDADASNFVAGELVPE